MLRRACFWLLPALMPLALLLVLPKGGARTVQVPAIERGCGAAMDVANGPLNHHQQAASDSTQWIDEGDDADSFAGARSIFTWPPVKPSVDPGRVDDALRWTHPACANFARGPPSA